MATMSAIDFGSLVGAQLTALIEAEAEAAEKSSEYIESVGFEKDPRTGALKLRMVSFEMRRRDVDGEVRTHIIEVPVLTLVPIPLLTIEEAEIDFDLQVENVVQEKVDTQNTPARGTANSIRDSLISRSVKSLRQPRSRLVTRLARTTKTDTKTAADLTMKVKIAQSPFPIGIERLINVADLSVEDNTNDQ